MSRGGAASGQKGSRYERELVTTLRNLQFGVLRCPSSGSATDEDLPDILAGRPVRPLGGAEIRQSAETATLDHRRADAWAIEHKSGDGTTLYVDGGEVEALEAFARCFGATPLLGARYTTNGSPTKHFLVRPEDARITDGGNYGLPIDDIEQRAAVAIEPGDEPEIEEVAQDDV